MATNEDPVKTPRTLRTARLAAALGLGVLAIAGLGCGDQPKPNCITSPAPFAMRLIEKMRTGDCTNFGPAGFNADPEVGFISYYAQDSKAQPDYNKGSLAIQTTEMGNLFFTAQGFDVPSTATDGKVYSFGAFGTSAPDGNDICTVPTLSPTHIVLAAVPAVPDDPATEDDESFPGQPAVDAKLTWSNVKVYVTAASYGIQVQADLEDTRLGPGGQACTITYTTLSLAPAVPCAGEDANGDPIPDVTLCDPEPDPAAGRFTGSGLSPNTNYKCDETTLFCVLAADTVPSLKP